MKPGDWERLWVGVVLIQEERPISFKSKKFAPSQHNRPTHEKQLYDVIHALKSWRRYLYGFEFCEDVHHDTLKYFCKNPNFSGHQASWVELM